MTLSYQQILESAGYPSDVLVLDFETFYSKEYSLSKYSTIEYITDSRFEVMGLGAKFANVTIAGVLYPDWSVLYRPDEIEDFLNKTNVDKLTVVVKNARFDVTVLKEKYGIVPKFIIDIEDLSRNWDSRMKQKLSVLAPLFGLQAKGDTKQFLGLHYKDMTSEQKTALSEYCLNDVNLEFELFKTLLPYLTNPSTELRLARHTLDLYLNPKIKFDFMAAIKLTHAMESEMQQVISKSGCDKEVLSGNKSFVDILNVALPEGELIPMKAGKNKMIPALAKDDEGLRYLLNHPKQEVRELVKARQAVKSWPLHIKRIKGLMNQARASGGFLRIPLKYYGGHTGRWSGTENINPQNLGAAGRAGRGTHELISKVRELLLAPDNHEFIIIDSAQIEARVLAWFAGQKDLIYGFSNNQDIYSVFATRLFGNEVRKVREGDSDTDAKILKIRRGFGKDAILGCGFGMGATKFHDRCLQNNDLRPIFDSGEYNFTFIDGLIKTYRATYPRIPEFWALVEKCFRHVIKFHDAVISVVAKDFELRPQSQDAGTMSAVNNGILTFWNDCGTVNLQLPSGRVLYYRHCRIGNDGQIKWHHGDLWGGSITENIVQATARDLFGGWILEFERRGLPVVLHTHDEIVSLVPKDYWHYLRLSMANSIMNHGPDWAKGLPLASEGVISNVYKK